MPIDMTGIKTVVCIEDELEMIELIRLILGRRGIEFVGTPTGSEGLETIRCLKPDLVLLDTQTPGAWDVYFAMKADEELKHIPIQMTTARAQGIDQILGRFGD